VFFPILALHLLSQSPRTVELYRGAAIEGVSPRYWETEDTTLDATGADLNLGWQTELYGGDGKTILIQFRGLNRVLGPNKRVVGASLVFSVASGAKITFGGIGRVLQAWNQGPIRTLLEMNPDNAPTVGDIGAATWRRRRLGGPSWSHTGALGPEDSQPIPEASMSQPDQDHLEIDNLGGVVEKMLEQPFDNHGFVLQFKAPVSFYSAEAPRLRPRLVLQVEDAAPAAGPRLAVTFIERKQKYERYESESGVKVESQDGQPVPVLEHPLNDMSKKWPSEGEELVYIAHVKNVGDAASAPFTAQAYVDDKPAGASQQGQALQPGEEALFPIRAKYHGDPTDHRLQPLDFRVSAPASPGGSLEIDQDALGIGVFVEKSFYDRANKGSRSFEEWIGGQVALLNDVYFPYSRFSFAKDGVLERLRIDHLEVVPDGTLQGPRNLPGGHEDLSYDAELGFPASDSEDIGRMGRSADLPLLKRLLLQLGLVDFAAVTYPAGDARLQTVGKDHNVSRGLEDLYPDLMGGGDTRDEAPLATSYSFPYQPVSDFVVDQAGLEPTDLLSASSVSEFNTDLSKRRGFQGDFLYDTPVLSLITVYDYNGNTVPKAHLVFFQMANGGFSANSRFFTLTTTDDGVATLFKRDPLTGGDDKLTTGHVLTSNPFGRIDSRGLNSVFMVKATTAAGTEWAPLKLWQLVDADHRGQKAALLRLYFNLPSDPLDVGTDVAQGKIISASTGDQPTLARLLDGAASAEVQLPREKDSWIEIDLGKDRTIGEVQLLSKGGPFWKSFEMQSYETAQKPTEALPWSKELDWDWSKRNRPDPVAGGGFSVAYRGSARRFRYLRIVNTGPATDAVLTGIRLVPVKQG